MPPSGFSPKAIKGLLEFVRASYESMLSQFPKDGSISESAFLTERSKLLKEKVRATIKQNTSLEISEEGVEGLVTFVTSCFDDLVAEIKNGRDKYLRPVVDGKAIQKELNQIGSYLEAFTI